MDRIVKKIMMVEAIETYALSRRSIFKRNGDLVPCLGKNYLAYSAELRRDLLAIGLKRRMKDVPSLQDYLQARASQADGAQLDHDLDHPGIANREDAQEADHALTREEDQRVED